MVSGSLQLVCNENVQINDKLLLFEQNLQWLVLMGYLSWAAMVSCLRTALTWTTSSLAAADLRTCLAF